MTESDIWFRKIIAGGTTGGRKGNPPGGYCRFQKRGIRGLLTATGSDWGVANRYKKVLRSRNQKGFYL